MPIFAEFIPEDTTKAEIKLKEKPQPKETKPEIVEERIIEEDRHVIDVTVTKEAKKGASVILESKEIPELEWDIRQVIEKEVTVESTGYETELISIPSKPAEVTITTESIVTKPEKEEIIEEKIELKQPERQRQAEEEKQITIIQKVEEERKRHDIIIQAISEKGITEIHLRKAPEHADEFTVPIDDEFCKEFDIAPQRSHKSDISFSDITPMYITTVQGFESAQPKDSTQVEPKSAKPGLTPLASISLSETLLHDTTSPLPKDKIFELVPDKQIDTLHTLIVQEKHSFEETSPYNAVIPEERQAQLDVLLQTPLHIEDTLTNEKITDTTIKLPVTSQAQVDLLSHRALQVVRTHYDEKEQSIEQVRPASIQLQSISNLDVMITPESSELLPLLGPDERPSQIADCRLLPLSALHVEEAVPHDHENVFISEVTHSEKSTSEIVAQHAVNVVQTESSMKEGVVAELKMHSASARPLLTELYETIIEEVVPANKESELKTIAPIESITTSNFDTVSALQQQYNTELDSEKILVSEEVVVKTATGNFIEITIPELSETVLSESLGEQPDDKKNFQQGKLIQNLQTAINVSQPIQGDTEALYVTPAMPEQHYITPELIPRIALEVQGVQTTEREELIDEVFLPTVQKAATDVAFQEAVSVLATLTSEKELILSKDKLPRGQKVQQREIIEKRKAAVVTIATTNEKELNIEDFVYDTHKALPDVLEQTALTVMHVCTDEKENLHLSQSPQADRAQFDFVPVSPYETSETIATETESDFTRDIIKAKTAKNEFELHKTAIHGEQIAIDKETDFVLLELTGKKAKPKLSPLEPLDVVQTRPQEIVGKFDIQPPENVHADIDFAERIALQTIQTVIQDREGTLEVFKPNEISAKKVGLELTPVEVLESLGFCQAKDYVPEKPLEQKPNVELLENRTMYIEEIICIEREEGCEPLKPVTQQKNFSIIESMATEVTQVQADDNIKPRKKAELPETSKVEIRFLPNISSESFETSQYGTTGTLKDVTLDKSQADSIFQLSESAICQQVESAIKEEYLPKFIVPEGQNLCFTIDNDRSIEIRENQPLDNISDFIKKDVASHHASVDIEIAKALESEITRSNEKEEILERKKANVTRIRPALMLQEPLLVSEYHMDKEGILEGSPKPETQNVTVQRVVSVARGVAETLLLESESVSIVEKANEKTLVGELILAQALSTEAVQPTESEIVMSHPDQPETRRVEKDFIHKQPIVVHEVTTNELEGGFVVSEQLTNKVQPQILQQGAVEVRETKSLDMEGALDIAEKIPELQAQPQLSEISAVNVTVQTALQGAHTFDVVPQDASSAVIAPVEGQRVAQIHIQSSCELESGLEEFVIPETHKVTTAPLDVLRVGQVEQVQSFLKEDIFDKLKADEKKTKIELLLKEALNVDVVQFMDKEESFKKILEHKSAKEVQGVLEAMEVYAIVQGNKEGVLEIPVKPDRHNIQQRGVIKVYHTSEQFAVQPNEAEAKFAVAKPQTKGTEVSFDFLEPTTISEQILIETEVVLPADVFPSVLNAVPEINPLFSVNVQSLLVAEKENTLSLTKAIDKTASVDLIREHALEVEFVAPDHSTRSFDVVDAVTGNATADLIPQSALEINSTQSASKEGLFTEKPVLAANIAPYLSGSLSGLTVMQTTADDQLGTVEEFAPAETTGHRLIDKQTPVTVRDLQSGEVARVEAFELKYITNNAESNLQTSSEIAIVENVLADKEDSLKDFVQRDTSISAVTIEKTEALGVTIIQTAELECTRAADIQPITLQASSDFLPQIGLGVAQTVHSVDTEDLKIEQPEQAKPVGSFTSKHPIQITEVVAADSKDNLQPVAKKPAVQAKGSIPFSESIEVSTCQLVHSTGDMVVSKVITDTVRQDLLPQNAINIDSIILSERPVDFLEKAVVTKTCLEGTSEVKKHAFHIQETILQDSKADFEVTVPSKAHAEQDLLLLESYQTSEVTEAQKEGDFQAIVPSERKSKIVIPTKEHMTVAQTIEHDNTKILEQVKPYTSAADVLVEESIGLDIKEVIPGEGEFILDTQIYPQMQHAQKTFCQLAHLNVNQVIAGTECSDLQILDLPAGKKAQLGFVEHETLAREEVVPADKPGHFKSEQVAHNTANINLIAKRQLVIGQTVTSEAEGSLMPVQLPETKTVNFCVVLQSGLTAETVMPSEREEQLTAYCEPVTKNALVDLSVHDHSVSVCMTSTASKEESFAVDAAPESTADVGLVPQVAVNAFEVTPQTREGEVETACWDKGRARTMLDVLEPFTTTDTVVIETEGAFAPCQLPDAQHGVAELSLPSYRSLNVQQVTHAYVLGDVVLKRIEECTTSLGILPNQPLTITEMEGQDQLRELIQDQPVSKRANLSVIETQHIGVRADTVVHTTGEFVSSILPEQHQARPELLAQNTIAIEQVSIAEYEGRFSPDKPLLQSATTDLTRHHAVAVSEMTPVQKEESFTSEELPSGRSVEVTIPEYSAINVTATETTEVPEEGVTPLYMKPENAKIALIHQETAQTIIPVVHEKELEFAKKEMPFERNVQPTVQTKQALEVLEVGSLQKSEILRTLPVPKASVAETEIIASTTVAVTDTEAINTVGTHELCRLPRGETADMSIPCAEAVSVISVESSQKENVFISPKFPATIEAKFSVPTRDHVFVRSIESANKEAPLDTWEMPMTFEANTSMPVNTAVLVQHTASHHKEGEMKDFKRPAEQRLETELVMQAPLEIQAVISANREDKLEPDEAPIEFTADIAMKLSAPLHIIETTSQDKEKEFAREEPYFATAKRDISLSANIMVQQIVPEEREGGSPETLVIRPQEADTSFSTQESLQVTQQTLPIAEEELRPSQLPEGQKAQQDLLLHKEVNVHAVQANIKEIAMAPFKTPDTVHLDFTIPLHEHTTVQLATSTFSEGKFVPKALPATEAVISRMTTTQHVTVSETVPAQLESDLMPDKAPISLSADVKFLAQKHRIQSEIISCATSEDFTVSPEKTSTAGFSVPTDEHIVIQHSATLQKETELLEEKPRTFQLTEFSVPEQQAIISEEVIPANKEALFSEDKVQKRRAADFSIPFEESIIATQIVLASKEQDLPEDVKPFKDTALVKIPFDEQTFIVETIETVAQDKEGEFASPKPPKQGVADLSMISQEHIGVQDVTSALKEEELVPAKIPEGIQTNFTIPLKDHVSVTEIVCNTQEEEVDFKPTFRTASASLGFTTEKHIIVEESIENLKESEYTPDKLAPTTEAAVEFERKDHICIQETTILAETEQFEGTPTKRNQAAFSVSSQETVQVAEVITEDKEGEYVPEGLPESRQAGFNLTTQETFAVGEITAQENVPEGLELKEPISKTAKVWYDALSYITVEETQPTDIEDVFYDAEAPTDTAHISIDSKKHIVIQQTISEDKEGGFYPEQRKANTASVVIGSFQPVIVQKVTTTQETEKLTPLKLPKGKNIESAIIMQEHLSKQEVETAQKESEFIPKALPDSDKADFSVATAKHISVSETVHNVAEIELPADVKPLKGIAKVDLESQEVGIIEETVFIIKEEEFESTPTPKMYTADSSVPSSEHVIVQSVTAHNKEETLASFRAPDSIPTDFSITAAEHIVSQEVLFSLKEDELQPDKKPQENVANMSVTSDIPIQVVSTMLQDKECEYTPGKLPEGFQPDVDLIFSDYVFQSVVVPEDREHTLEDAPKPKTGSASFSVVSIEALLQQQTEATLKEGLLRDFQVPEGVTTEYEIIPVQHTKKAQVVYGEKEDELPEQKLPTFKQTRQSFVTSEHVAITETEVDERESNLQPEKPATLSKTSFTIETGETYSVEQVQPEYREESFEGKYEPKAATACVNITHEKHVQVTEVTGENKEDEFVAPKQPKSANPAVSFDTREHIMVQEAMTSFETEKLPLFVMQTSEIDVKLTESHHVLVHQTITEVTTKDLEEKKPVSDKATDHIEIAQPIEIIELVTDYGVKQLPEMEIIEATARTKEQKSTKGVTVTIEEEDVPEESSGVTIKKTVKRKKSVRFAEAGDEQVEQITEVLHTFRRDEQKVGPVIEEVSEEFAAGPQPTPIVEEAEEETPLDSKTKATIAVEEVIGEITPVEHTYRITEPDEQEEVQISVTVKKDKKKTPITVESEGAPEMTITEKIDQPVQILEEIVHSEEITPETVIVATKSAVKKESRHITLESQTVELDLAQETHQEFAVLSEEMAEMYTSQEVTVSRKIKSTKVQPEEPHAETQTDILLKPKPKPKEQMPTDKKGDEQKEETAIIVSVKKEPEEEKPIEIESVVSDFTIAQEVKREVTTETITTSDERPAEFTILTKTKPKKELTPKQEELTGQITLKPKAKEISLPKEDDTEIKEPQLTVEILDRKKSDQEVLPVKVESVEAEFDVTQFKVQQIEETSGVYRETTIEVASEGEDRPHDFREYSTQKLHEIEVTQEEFSTTKPLEDETEEAKITFKKKKSIPKIPEGDKATKDDRKEDTTAQILAKKKPKDKHPIELDSQSVEVTVIQEKPKTTEIVSVDKLKRELEDDKAVESISLKPKKKDSLKPSEDIRSEEAPSVDVAIQRKKDETRPIAVDSEGTSLEITQKIEKTLTVESWETAQSVEEAPCTYKEFSVESVYEVPGKPSELATVISIEKPGEMEQRPQKAVLTIKKETTPKEKDVEIKKTTDGVSIRKKSEDEPIVESEALSTDITVTQDTPQSVVVDKEVLKKEMPTDKVEEQTTKIKLRPKKRPSISADVPTKEEEESVEFVIRKPSIKPEVQKGIEATLTQTQEIKTLDVEASKEIAIREEVPTVDEEKPLEATLKLQKKKSILEETPKVSEDKPQEAELTAQKVKLKMKPKQAKDVQEEFTALIKKEEKDVEAELMLQQEEFTSEAIDIEVTLESVPEPAPTEYEDTSELIVRKPDEKPKPREPKIIHKAPEKEVVPKVRRQPDVIREEDSYESEGDEHGSEPEEAGEDFVIDETCTVPIRKSGRKKKAPEEAPEEATELVIDDSKLGSDADVVSLQLSVQKPGVEEVQALEVVMKKPADKKVEGKYNQLVAACAQRFVHGAVLGKQEGLSA